MAVAAFGVDVELEITSVELSSAETCFSVWGCGLRFWGLGFGFGVWGLGFEVSGFECLDRHCGCRGRRSWARSLLLRVEYLTYTVIYCNTILV